MTTAHSTLTGSNLHENKGVAAASNDTVATAASGVTLWQKLTASNLTGTGNSFGGQLFHCTYEVSQGTDGQSDSSGWFNVQFNTTRTSEISGAAIVSNQFSLPAGTYWIEGKTMYSNGNNGLLASRCYNVTDNSVIFNGTSHVFSSSSNIFAYPEIAGRFTLSGTKTIAFQVQTSVIGGKLGRASNLSGEMYSSIKIFKVS